MIPGMTLYDFLWFFVLYSMLGWCVEVVYQAVKKGIVVNRGFLNGPVCPVYGFGMNAILVLASLVCDGNPEGMNPVLLFVVGIIFTTTIELTAGKILDMAFHARWWDYSGKPFNLNGYICLEFSIIWGLGTVFVIKLVHPLIRHLSVDLIAPDYGWPMLMVIYATLAADLTLTVATVRGLNRKLKEIDDLSTIMRTPSDMISKTLAENAIQTSVKIEEGKVQAALARTEALNLYEAKKEDADRRIRELTSSLLEYHFFGPDRILRAFPTIEHRNFGDALEEIRKAAAREKRWGRKLFLNKEEKEQQEEIQE